MGDSVAYLSYLLFLCLDSLLLSFSGACLKGGMFSALSCSSALVVLRCLVCLVHICLFMTRKLFVIILDGILSLNRFLYPCINLWKAGAGIPSPLLVKKEGGTWDPALLLSCSSLNNFQYRLLNFPLRQVLRKGPWGAGPTGSPSPAIVPLKELHLTTIKGYLMTNPPPPR
jgi:hypothetical protein